MPIKSVDFIFLGTSNFAVGVLESLKKSGLVPSMILTLPDKPAGRGLKPSPPPIKKWAEKNRLRFSQPEELSGLEGHNLAVVAAYGKLIPQSTIESFKYGILNIHPSLLPRYRGPTPIQSAILAGEKETGVTIMLLDEKLDHGPILSSIKYQLSSIKAYKELEKELAELGAKLLIETIPDWLSGKIEPKEQNHSQATFTRKFTTQDGFIAPEIILGSPRRANLAVSPPSDNLAAYRKVLALNPEPGTWTMLGTRNQKLARIKITEAELEDEKFFPVKVIPAGKREMSWEEFKRGNLSA